MRPGPVAGAMAKAIPLTVLLLALPLASLPMGNASDVSDNLLANASFELDADGDGVPDGWTIASDGTFVARVAGAAQEGTFAVALSRPAADVGRGSIVSDVIAVEPGATYRLTGWFAGNGAAHFGVTFGAPGSVPDVSIRTPISAAAAPWRNVSAEFIVPYGVTEARVAVYDGGVTASLIDHLSLVRLAGTGNVVPGHSFETGSYAGRPDFWTLDCDEGSFSWFTSGAPHGARSLGLAPAPRAHCAKATSVWAAVEGGQSYELSAAHYIVAGSSRFGVRMLAAEDDVNALPLAEAILTVTAPVRAWGTDSFVFCVPEGAAKAQLFIEAPAAGQNINWDNVSLKPAGPCAAE